MCARVVRVNVTSIGVKCVSQMKSHVSSPASDVFSLADGRFLNLYSQSINEITDSEPVNDSINKYRRMYSCVMIEHGAAPLSASDESPRVSAAVSRENAVRCHLASSR